jgi:LPXTG-motif cell wall-anchored protein
MFSFKKLGAVSATAAIIAAVALTATPAQASGEFGSLVTINPSGGTSATDGLKIEIAGGQMQVFRGGAEQFYQLSPSPDAGSECAMYNYFTVAIAATTPAIVGCDYYPGDAATNPNLVTWASGTITSNLTNNDQDGTVTLMLVSNDVEAGTAITLQVVYTYTYPNPYVDLQATLTIPPGITGFTGAKLYWNVDATLGGADEGNQIQGTLADGSAITGVVAADGSAIEAFNQLPGQNMQSWAGGFTCAWDETQVGDTACPNSQGGWTFNGTDISAGISTDTDIDNGWGVQAPNMTTNGNSVNSWRVYFVSCLDSSLTALQCIDASTKAKLPNTGVDAGAIAGALGGAVALGLVGIALVAIRRRSVA